MSKDGTENTMTKSETSKTTITFGTERRAFWKAVTGCWSKCKKKSRQRQDSA